MSSSQSNESKPQLASYFLLSHSALPPASGPTQGSSFVHPEIVYHFADDPPLALVPAEDRDVLIMDYDPASTEPPKVRSMSGNVAVRGVHVDREGGTPEGMIVVETVALSSASAAVEGSSLPPADSSLSLPRFAQRNALLRQALDYKPCCEQEAPKSPDRAPDGPADSSPTSTI